MHVYVDESGTFSIPKPAKHSAISCSGALTIPTASHDEIIDGFQRLSHRWPKERGEIKGRLLQEEHFDAALAFYADCGLLLEAVAIDLGTHDTSTIIRHKLKAVDEILRNVSDQRQPEMNAALKALASRMHAISVPEYVQMIVMTEVIDNAFRTNFRWFPLIAPLELSSFVWMIDGKEVAPARMESLWNQVCFPWLQTSSLEQPLMIIREGDYSHLPPGVQRQQPKVPEHLASLISKPKEPFSYFDIGTVLRRLSFANSTDNLGLQMVDVAISAVRRAMIGNLQHQGWRRLGSILVHAPDPQSEVVKMVHIGDGPMHWKSKPRYHDVLVTLRGEALPSLPPHNWGRNRQT